jgi:hypothetical protein
MTYRPFARRPLGGLEVAEQKAQKSGKVGPFTGAGPRPCLQDFRRYGTIKGEGSALSFGFPVYCREKAA